jgi:hypothetical protein
MQRSASFALLFAAFVSCAWPAHADLAGVPEQPPPLTAVEREMLASNPDLEGLAESAPWMVRRALSILAVAPKDAQISGWTDPLNAADARIVGRNPALVTIQQASPEAAAELLALIRAAGTGRKGYSDE